MNPKPTHIQLVQHLQPGGIETMALDLCRFTEAGKHALIVSLEGTKENALARWPRLQAVADQLVFLDKPQGWSLSTIWTLSRLLRQLNTERLHTHHIGPMLYGGMAARLAGVRQWVHTEHDAWHLHNKNHRRIAAFCIKHLKPLLVADAGLVAQQLQQKLPGVIADVVYNGIDTERFCPGDANQAREKLGLPLDRQLIGCAARLHPVKGQQRLIPLLNHFHKDVELVLAGDGETKASLIRQATELGVLDRIHFLGAIDDMPSFYRAIDVFCLTSDFEGLPLSPIEAQACGTPAIVTDVGGAKETVCPNTGAVVPVDHAPSLIAAVANVFVNSNQQSPRPFVVERYDVTSMVTQYSSLVNIRWPA